MTLYRTGETIPDKQCPNCQGQLEVVEEHSLVTSGDTFSTQRHYVVKCRKCDRRFVYNTDARSLMPERA